jgi:two-component system chemotaxis response regulator CheB
MGTPIRVLLVDDSVFLRQTLTKRLGADPDIVIVGDAVDGLDALSKIPVLKPHVVVLDIEMPRMDGLTALQRIMAECPTPVVMLSAHTQRGARITIQALLRGAVDFVPKPAAGIHIKNTVEELMAKIKIAASTPPSSPSISPLAGGAAPTKVKSRPFRPGDPVIVIGSSTGGPRALQQVLSGLPADLPAAMVVVQHMPPAFVRPLVQRLNEGAPLVVQEAASGKHLACGLALVAPGDYHVQFGASGRVVLDQGPRRNHVRPAVDVTMESAAEHFKSSVIGVVLTGMGTDGTQGAGRIKAAGGKVIAEHESTCVVYGMPRSVAEAGWTDRIVPLPEVASTLMEWVG